MLLNHSPSGDTVPKTVPLTCMIFRAPVAILPDSVQRYGIAFEYPKQDFSITTKTRIVAVCLRYSSWGFAAVEPCEPYSCSSIWLPHCGHDAIVAGHVIAGHQLAGK